MSIWENQSKDFRLSITDSIRRWAKKERSDKRKEKKERLYRKESGGLHRRR